MRTRTEADKARRIFYSRADETEMIIGYARIHNAARRELKRARVNGKGRRLLEHVAWSAYLEGWSKV